MDRKKRINELRDLITFRAERIRERVHLAELMAADALQSQEARDQLLGLEEALHVLDDPEGPEDDAVSGRAVAGVAIVGVDMRSE